MFRHLRQAKNKDLHKRASHYNDEGDEIGKTKPRKSKGISIIPESFPKDKREGWVDMDNRGVVYNTGHVFSKSVENNPSL